MTRPHPSAKPAIVTSKPCPRGCGTPVKPHSTKAMVFDLAPDRLTHTCPTQTELPTMSTSPFQQPASTDRPTIPIPPTVLRGPADADHYRVKVGRYGDRWYTDPLPACPIAPAVDPTRDTWPSVSTIKKASGSDWTFVGLKRVAAELRDNPRALDGLDYDACYDRLKSINKLGLGRAGKRGTNVHLYFEKGLRGHGIDVVEHPDEPGAEYLPAVRAFFDTYRPELVAAEVVCIDRDLNGTGYGGTSDGVISLDHPDGGRATVWVDWKSRGADSDHGAYPEEGAQLGAYASAAYMLVETTNGPARQALPHTDGGLIVSVKPDGVRLYPIDMDKATGHWRSLHSWWVARRDERGCVGKPWAPRSIPTPAFASLAEMAATLDDLHGLYEQAVAAGQWNDDLKAAFRARKQQLQQQHAA